MIAAVPLSAPPATWIASEVSVGAAPDPATALRQVAFGSNGRLRLRGLFAGWQANMGKDIPFAVAKLTIFEALVRHYERWALPPTTAANWKERMGLGVVSGMATAVLTNPLDVIRNEMFKTDLPVGRTLSKLVREEGASFLTRGIGKNLVAVAIPIAVTIFTTDRLVALKYN